MVLAEEVSTNTVVATIVGTDADAGTDFTYALNGTDAALFSINTDTGVIEFEASPDFETPLDNGGNNIYDLTVTVSDGTGTTDNQALTVTVTNIDDNDPGFNGATPSTVVLAEEGSVNTVVATIVGSDADAGTDFTYALNGTDAALFSINTDTGVIEFEASPDFETPLDGGADNIYDLTVTVSDGTGTTDNQSLTVTVTDIDDNDPTFAGATPSNAVLAEEVSTNTVVATIVGTDADAGTDFTYALNGTDAALFSINTDTGVIEFEASPDHETPLDNGGNNIYDLTVTVSDGTGTTDNQALTVTVTNIDDNDPGFNGATPSTVVLAEEGSVNTVVATIVGSDADAGTDFTYALNGTDAALFSINTDTGVIEFEASPDFETPLDNGGNNVYDLTVTVSDGTGTTDNQSLTVTVTDIDDNDPTFAGATPSNAVLAEEVSTNTVVATIVGTDADAGTDFTYSLGGTDAALFSINTDTGVVEFEASPDHETPLDNGGNNIYDLTVTVSDGTGTTDNQALTVTVTNIDDNDPGFNAATPTNVNFAEESSDSAVVATIVGSDADAGTDLTYALNGTDVGQFSIDTMSGDIFFSPSPDHEAPLDNGANNIYDLTVTVSDGTGTTGNQSLTVTVTDIDDNDPGFNGSSPTSATIAEEVSAGTAVMTIIGSDADADADFTYTLGGTDAAAFSINTDTGVLEFDASPDFEAPLDSGTNNVYDLEVTVSDGDGTTDSQALTVTVTNVEDPPEFLSAASATVAENLGVGTAAIDVNATDPEGVASPTFSLGGTDAAAFSINTMTGEIKFEVSPDFESPADSGSDNVYDLIVTATDTLTASTQTLTITVTDVDDNNPVITSANSATVDDGHSVDVAVLTVQSSDADVSDTPTYSLGGTDALDFSINTATGEIYFELSPDTGSPDDANMDNVYEVTATVSDGSAPVGTQALTITVADDSPAVYTSIQLTGTDAHNHPSANVMDGTLGFKINGTYGHNSISTSGGLTGKRVAAAGDVDGDGFDDFLISGYRVGGGRTYLLFGKSSTDFEAMLPATEEEGFSLFNTNDESGDTFNNGAAFNLLDAGAGVGWGLGGGDVNGDGYSDIVMGNKGSLDNIVREAFLVMGGSKANIDDLHDALEDAGELVLPTDQGYFFQSESAVTDVNGDNLDDVAVFTGTDAYTAGDQIALVANVLGDINGDGKDDLIFGQSGRSTNDHGGDVFIVFGDDNGDNGGVNDNLNTVGALHSMADAAGLHFYDGGTFPGYPGGIEANLGFDVASAGDVNGDGYDDILIGAVDRLENFRGGVFLIFGDSTSSLEVLEDAQSGGNGLDTLDGTNGVQFSGLHYLPDFYSGATFGVQFGYSVNTIGDFNGDGYDDFAVGGPMNGYSQPSYTAIVFGRASWDADIRLGGVDSAGGSHLTDLSSVSSPTFTSNGFIIRSGGAVGSADLGSAVHGGGDVNGDGLDDLIVLSRDTGYASVIFGMDDANIANGASGILTQDAGGSGYWMVDLGGSDGSAFDVGNLLEGKGLALRTGGGQNVDGDVAIAGDVNGDGYDDILVGAGLQDIDTVPAGETIEGLGGEGAGQAYIVYGQDFAAGSLPVDVETSGSTADADGEAFVGDATNNSLSDGGFDNVSLRGGLGNDTFRVTLNSSGGTESGSNVRKVDGGAGFDVIRQVTGVDDNMNFDFEALRASGARQSSRFDSIEKINMDGGTNTVDIDVMDVLAITDTVIDINGTNLRAFFIRGDAVDTVNLGAGFNAADQGDYVDDVTYDIYLASDTGNLAALLVEQEITIA